MVVVQTSLEVVGEHPLPKLNREREALKEKEEHWESFIKDEC